MTLNGITPERLLSLERRIAQLESRDDRYRVRAVASQPRPQIRWAKTTTPYGVDYPGTGNTFRFIFVERTYTEEAGFQVVTNTNLGDLDAPEHFLNSNRYIDEGDIVPVFEVDGQWWEFDETTEGSTAKLIQLNMTQAAYENLSGGGVITTFLPAGTGYELTRNDTTGEVVASATEVPVVNAAPRIYGGANSSRSRVVVAVPIAGGKYVPIPMATDPFLDACFCQYVPSAHSSASGTISSDQDNTSTIPEFDNTSEYDLLPGQFGAANPSAESWPHWCRLENNKIYLPYPGQYLVLSQVQINVRTDGTDHYGGRTFTTTTVSSHNHQVTVMLYPLVHGYWKIDHGTAGNRQWTEGDQISVHSFQFFTQRDGTSTRMHTSHFHHTVVQIEHTAAVEERWIRPWLQYTFTDYGAVCPKLRTFVQLTIIPLSKAYLMGDTDAKAEWNHNAYADGTWKWYGTGTAPS